MTCWNPRFRRSFFDCKLEMVEEFLHLQSLVYIQVTLLMSQSGKNLEKEFYQLSHTFMVMCSAVALSFPATQIQASKLSSKISLFAWKAAWGKFLKSHHLMKRGSNLQVEEENCMEDDFYAFLDQLEIKEQNNISRFYKLFWWLKTLFKIYICLIKLL